MAREKSLADVQQPRNDAYTVMLSISLVAMIAACILLYQEVHRYPHLKPTAQDMQPPPVNVGGGAGGGDVQFQAPDGGGDATKAPPGGGAETKPQNPGGNPNP
jgi:hypothetical protein